MIDYPPKDYEERMIRSKDFAVAEFLSTGARRVEGPSIVISAYRDGSMITVNTLPSMNPNSTNSDRRAFIPKSEPKDHIIDLVLEAIVAKNYFDKLTLQNTRTFPAGQVPSIIERIGEVASYSGSLPFYAKVIMRAHPRFN